MKFRLITCFSLLINLACYANCSRNGYYLTDTTVHQKVKHIFKRKIVPHVTYTRESIKGYKPEFDNCIYTKRFTVAQRLKKYPFSVAAKIIAISYVGGGQPNQDIIIDSAGNSIRNPKQAPDTIPGIIIENHRLKYDNVKQSKILTNKEIENFTDIIYNYGYSGMKNYLIVGFTNCFEPRNSIVFLDKKGKVIDHLDICFHCQRSESESRKIDEGVPCTQKYQMLRDFFIDIGVSYGTTGKTYDFPNN
ncbi:hypothetical protein [Mucilaginibacter sp. NFR10]|jgi:hypothetical protein|uniref:hypothetical protein n=1 Tax=Mucilaginibacter sp. NFR10 TaxID=1566292 RepID=UPI0008719E78|nr:hypothetical protein [Mucilaginibacter sp. NFR10]SCW41346.1 hypothetical protein SAMN03159284_00436 [Mucilaginibacter sp. NFR10]